MSQPHPAHESSTEFGHRPSHALSNAALAVSEDELVLAIKNGFCCRSESTSSAV